MLAAYPASPIEHQDYNVRFPDPLMPDDVPPTDQLHDSERLDELRSLDLLDTPREEVFDCFTRLAARFLDAPVALFSLVEEDRQFFKSQVGLPEPWATARETPLSHSFCQHAVTSGEALIIEDAREHPLVHDNLAIRDLGVVAYAGIPLTTADGHTIGSFCAIDDKPHTWTEQEIEVLRDLASGLLTEVRLRQDLSRRARAEALLAAEKRVLEAISTGRPLAEVLDMLIRSIEEGAAALRCSILLVDPHGNQLHVASAPGLPDEVNAAMDGLRIGGDMAPCAAAASRGERVIVTDVGAAPSCVKFADLLLRHELRAVTSIPILSSPGQVLGIFAAYFGEAREPYPDEMEALSRGGNIASIAIERARVEESLHQLTAHYERLVDTSPIGIYALDTEGRCTEVNAALAEILGRSAGDLLGRHFADIVAPEDLQDVSRSFGRTVTGEREGTSNEFHVLRPSGERRLVRIRAAAICEGDLVLGTHGVLRGITEEREREARLRRAERLASIGTLIGGVAHELNNRLHAIRGFTDLLLLDEASPERREDLETIHRETERMAKIVSDLRLVARRTQEEEALRTRVDLNDVVVHVLRTREYALSTRNIQVRQDLAPDLRAVWGQRGQLEQVVLNLVVNAEQAMTSSDGDKRLIVRTRTSVQGVSLHIIDTGPGIPHKHLERIFDPFWTTKAPGEGTGLGLPLVHSIVSDHGGEIRVDSQVGEGTAFRIDVPAAAPHTTAIAEVDARDSVRSRPLRVLVVDDEAAVRRAFTRFLQQRGHVVDEADEGGAALELIAQQNYAVIVSDLRMPGLGGEELLIRLRDQGRGMERRLIFLTGDAASEDARRVMEEANVPVLLKPINLPEMDAAVERHEQHTRI